MEMNSNYLQGFLKAADTAGLSETQAYLALKNKLNEPTYTVDPKVYNRTENTLEGGRFQENLNKTQQNMKDIQEMVEASKARLSDKSGAWTEGFIKAAIDQGFTLGQAYDLLKLADNTSTTVGNIQSGVKPVNGLSAVTSARKATIPGMS